MHAQEIATLESRLASEPQTAGDTRSRIDALNDLAWAMRLQDGERAQELASEARELAISGDYKLGQARAARTLSMTMVRALGIRGAFEYAQEAKRLFDEVGDGVGSAASRDFLASAYEFIGDLPAGLEQALEALAMARDLGDKARQGFALSSVGGILGAIGNTDEAFERLHEALALFEEVHNDIGIGRICSRLSNLARRVGRREEALAHAQRALETAERSDNGFLRASALTALGELQTEEGNSEEAERLLREAIKAYPGGMRGGIGTGTQVSLGRLLAHRSAYTEAATELTAALDRIISSGVGPADEAAAHEALADLCERQGEHAKAVTHLKQAIALRDRAEQTEVRGKVAQVELRAEMEAAKKDAEIHKLRFVELHEMQSRLVEAERSAMVGTLAAGTAHELNSPLGVLRSNLSLYATAVQRLAEFDVSPPAPVQRLLEVLESCNDTNGQALRRIEAVADSLQRFTQLDNAEVRTFQVNAGLEDALSLLEPSLPDGVVVERLMGELPDMVGWPRELNQAFMTVLVNAAEALDGPGRIGVSTSLEGEQIRVAVTDTGRGMDEEARAHLFDVGWSARAGRVKMRLGLSAAHATVVRHGGSMTVTSALGEGTSVDFRLPLKVARGSDR